MNTFPFTIVLFDFLVLNILSILNFSTVYITCPTDAKKTLGIKLPFLVMIIKNLKKYFTFEVTVSKSFGELFYEGLLASAGPILGIF